MSYRSRNGEANVAINTVATMLTTAPQSPDVDSVQYGYVPTDLGSNIITVSQTWDATLNMWLAVPDFRNYHVIDQNAFDVAAADASNISEYIGFGGGKKYIKGFAASGIADTTMAGTVKVQLVVDGAAVAGAEVVLDSAAAGTNGQMRSYYVFPAPKELAAGVHVVSFAITPVAGGSGYIRDIDLTVEAGE